MKNIVNIFALGCLLYIASYFLPWIVSADGKESLCGYNIYESIMGFSDVKDVVLIFKLPHLVFAGAVICLILMFLNKKPQSRWIGLIAGVAGLIANTIIKLGLHEIYNKPYGIGFTLGYIGSAILVLQSFIGFFRKPLMG